MKTDLFQSCGHCWVFHICWHIECSTFTASSFRIWNSSSGLPSPPLALFIVMLSKAHLTSHSRMSGSRWVITPSWLSWLLLSKKWWFSDTVYYKNICFFIIFPHLHFHSRTPCSNIRPLNRSYIFHQFSILNLFSGKIYNIMF